MALHRFAHNTLFAMIAGAGTGLGSLVASIIVARFLGPAGAGAVALALWIAATSVTLGDLGLPLTVSRFLPDLHARGRDADAEALGRISFFPVLLTTLFGFCIALTLFLFGDALRLSHPGILPFENLAPTTWLAIGVVFAAQAVGNFATSLLRGEQRFRLAAHIALASLALQVASVALGSRLFGVEGALFGYAAASVLPGLVALRRKTAQQPLDAEIKRRAWTFALHSWGAGLISAIVWSRSEIAFLSHWRGTEEAGYYAVAITSTLLASQIPFLATGGLLPLFSERYGKADHEGLQRAYSKAMRFMALLLFPACFGMAAVAPLLLPLFFGPHFAKAADVTALLVATQSFGALSVVTSILLFAAERGRVLVQIGIFGALGLLVAGLTIIPAFGLMGTAATRALIQISLTVAASIYIARKLDCRLPLRSLVCILVAALACACAARFVIVEIQTPLGLVLAIATGAIVYALGIRIFKVLPEEDLAQIAALVHRLPASLARALLPFVAFFDTGRKPAG
ncbi:MAG: lipopolysaccharide biosynthesis protein [Beijerinckiaceae bacterium]